MRDALHIIICIATMAVPWCETMAQCPNNNTPIAGGAVTPPCPGSMTVPCVLGGQYALVNVVSGNTYTFSTCTATFDTQITVFNNAGGAALANNDDACGLQSSVTWVASFTGQVRVLVDRYVSFLNPCGNSAACAPLVIQCVPPPVGDCLYTLNMYDTFGDGWDGSTVGISINGSPFTNYTITGASGTAVIGLFIGDIIVVQYTEISPYPGEISYSLTPGCIWSDGPAPATGIVFTQTVDCQPAPAPPEDCAGAITICNNQAFNNNTTNTGCSADLGLANQGCLGAAERQGTWYYFSPSTSGNIAMTISPADPTDDYDFAIWGPMANPVCPPPGAPYRCSFAAPAGDTGLNYTATDPTEGAGGDKWVDDLPVVAGQVYIMYISNFSQSGLAFDLNWNLTNGASLDCTVLPIELLSFNAFARASTVELEWATASELDNDYFMVERSIDGNSFSAIGRVEGSGTSSAVTAYKLIDTAPFRGVGYYRLKQVDSDGSFTYSSTVAVAFGSLAQMGAPYPNPAIGAVSIDLISAFDGPCTVQALDATGRIVSQQQGVLTQGLCTLSLPITGADPGTYALRVLAPDGSCLHTGRFVVEQ